jgi:hypothetical protein
MIDNEDDRPATFLDVLLFLGLACVVVWFVGPWLLSVTH